MKESFSTSVVLGPWEQNPLSAFESCEKVQEAEQAKSTLEGMEQTTDHQEEEEQTEGGTSDTERISDEMEGIEQVTRELPSVPGLLQAEEYLSVHEAALVLGVSARSVYGYIETGKLQGIRIGASIAVQADAVRTFERQVVGRPRTRTPVWRVPTPMNQEYLISITVQMREGQEDLLEARMKQIQKQKKHVLPGSVARYISQDQADRRQIEILVFWRQISLPSQDDLHTALNTFYDDLADLFEWETAVWKKSKIVLSTH